MKTRQSGARLIRAVSLAAVTLACWPVIAHALSLHEIPLEDPVKLADQTIGYGETVRLLVPALPARPGKVAVLRFSAFSEGPERSGCNYNIGIKLNEATLGATVVGDKPRLLGRDRVLELAGGKYSGTIMPIFNGQGLLVPYAPDLANANRATCDGLGATFVLDISDLARGVDGNTLELRNLLPEGLLQQGSGRLIVKGLEIGWLDGSHMPVPPNEVPDRKPIGSRVEQGGLSLGQGTAGGFTVRMNGQLELSVETALGMAAQRPPVALRAEDGAITTPTVSAEQGG